MSQRNPSASERNISSKLIVSCDVGMDSLHLVCRGLAGGAFPSVFAIDNRSDAIRSTLTEIRSKAANAGQTDIGLVLEPTGVYDKLLLRIAHELGFETRLVSGEDVAKMRQVIFGDPGKTDARDPQAIEAVARHGRTAVVRALTQVFTLMRTWAKIYQDAEDEIVQAKGRIHRALKLLFPDLDFSTDFIYSPSRLMKEAIHAF